MDTASLHRSLDHNQQNMQALWTRSLDLGAKASAWVLAANATALVLCFNATLQNPDVEWQLLRSLGAVFFLGVATAFLSVLCEQRSFGEYSSRLATFVAKATNALNLLEQKRDIITASEKDPTNELKNEFEQVRGELAQLSEEMADFDFSSEAQLWGNRSNYLLAASCVALGSGVIAALWFFPT